MTKDTSFSAGKRQGKGKPRPESNRKDGYRSHEERLQVATDTLAALEAKMPGLAARRAALDVLMLLRKGRAMEDALQQCRTFNVLEGADRAFARHLVSTVLRRRGAIDEIIGGYLERPLPAKSVEVHDILRLATAQLVLLDTPPHAAVATAVELAHGKRETSGYKKLVNAIARKISEKGKDKLAKLPARVDTPGWMWRSWERSYGSARTREIATAHQQTAPLDLVLKPGTSVNLFETVEETEQLMEGRLRLPAGSSVRNLPGYDDGSWWVQDIAASLPINLLGDVTGKSVIDLCAAPGGKTMQLAAAGAEVTAVDISGPRLKRLQENLTRTNLSANLVTANALEWKPASPADAILIDAPCSATGTIRRNPDVTWSKTEDEVRQLAKLQTRFIDTAMEFVKPGGLIVYCTCSLQREEGEDQVKAALSRHDNLTLLPVTPDMVGGMTELVTKDGYMRALPSYLAGKGGMDGFFAALLRLE